MVGWLGDVNVLVITLYKYPRARRTYSMLAGWPRAAGTYISIYYSSSAGPEDFRGD